jgi:hypothetical protein
MVRFILLVMILPLVGCASIVSNDPGVVNIKTDPPQADCIVTNARNGQEVASIKSPSQLTLETDQGYFKPAKYVISCHKPGYLDNNQSLEADFDGWYVGNILFGGLIGMLIVDPLTGAMWDIENKNILVRLSPSSRLSMTPEGLEEMSLLIKGSTTMDEIKLKLGDPCDKESPASGYNYWGYYYEAVPKKLVLQFDHAGVLKDYVNKDI